MSRNFNRTGRKIVVSFPYGLLSRKNNMNNFYNKLQLFR